VLGSPIAHSKSPALHRAAYRVLGLDWDYRAVEVPSGALEGFLGGLDGSWRGLSLTMPLKREVLGLVDDLDEVVRLVGAANTVLFDGGGRHGFNTDVHGVTAALREAGVGRLSSVRMLGAGATAASVLAAVAELGATEVRLAAREPARAAGLAGLAETLGIRLEIGRLDDEESDGSGETGLVVSAIPGTVPLVREFPAALRRSVPLLEIAYDPWPTPLAQHWSRAGGTVVAGTGMLLHQALAQVRIFVTGSAGSPLEGEESVLAAMREALGATGAAH
jgi:shikimate dehydrogenase